MNLNQLHYFVTLAYMEHYTKAAKQLSITQPSLSHAIGMLEQELGTYLFEKQGRNVVLTKYGKVFLKYAEESLRVLDTGIKKTRSMTSETSGEIDIGYIYTQGSEFIPELVKNFLDENKEKDIQFHFNNGVTEEIVKGIKSERFDLGFCSYMKNEPDIEFIPITKEELADRAELCLCGHEHMAEYAGEETVDVICFNFGYLPGGDHKVATHAETSMQAILQGLKLLKHGGMMSLCIYSGGDTGFEEKDAILNLLRTLPSREYTVIANEYYNRKNNPPMPVFIFKS